MLMLPFNPAGLKLFPTTPVPDQIPPVVPVIVLLRLIAGSPEHTEAGAVHVELAINATEMACVMVLLHEPVPAV